MSDLSLLTPRQVAEMLRLSLATVSRMASADQIPHVVIKAGRRKKIIRFREKEIETWLSEHTRGGATGQGRKRKKGLNGDPVAIEGKKPAVGLV